MKLTVMIPMASLVLGLSGAVAGATTLTRTLGASHAEKNVVQVAGRECMRDEKGWHYMDRDRRRDCRPPAPKNKGWAWRCESGRCGWWHAKERRWND